MQLVYLYLLDYNSASSPYHIALQSEYDYALLQIGLRLCLDLGPGLCVSVCMQVPLRR